MAQKELMAELNRADLESWFTTREGGYAKVADFDGAHFYADHVACDVGKVRHSHRPDGGHGRVGYLHTCDLVARISNDEVTRLQELGALTMPNARARKAAAAKTTAEAAETVYIRTDEGLLDPLCENLRLRQKDVGRLFITRGGWPAELEIWHEECKCGFILHHLGKLHGAPHTQKTTCDVKGRTHDRCDAAPPRAPDEDFDLIRLATRAEQKADEQLPAEPTPHARNLEKSRKFAERYGRSGRVPCGKKKMDVDKPVGPQLEKKRREELEGLDSLTPEQRLEYFRAKILPDEDFPTIEEFKRRLSAPAPVTHETCPTCLGNKVAFNKDIKDFDPCPECLNTRGQATGFQIVKG